MSRAEDKIRSAYGRAYGETPELAHQRAYWAHPDRYWPGWYARTARRPTWHFIGRTVAAALVNLREESV